MHDSVNVHTGQVDASGLRIGIVAARFNEAVVERLADGAVDALVRHGASPDSILVAWVPGAMEVGVVLKKLAASGGYDALIAIGAVVRGSTPHFDFVAGESAKAVASIALEYGLPVGNGILTTDTWDQAVERAGGKLGNKGAEAALAVVETATLLKQL